MIVGAGRVRGLLRRGLILLYHRISDADGADPWGLRVSPHRFELHLQSLREQGFEPCRLADLLRGGPAFGRRGRVAVTFDDGCADNASTAAPILARHDVPATFFVVSGSVNSAEEFWWDRLERIVMGRGAALPATIEVTVRGRVHRVDAAGLMRAERAGVPEECVYRTVWTLMLSLTSGEQADVLDQLTGQVTVVPPVRPARLPMNSAQIARLADHPLFEIGAHTVSHRPLASLLPEDQTREIADSKTQIEALIGRPITGFSYPHGHHSATTVAAVRAAGFRLACTTRAGSCRMGERAHLLPRCFVGDWDLPQLEQRMAVWRSS